MPPGACPLGFGKDAHGSGQVHLVGIEGDATAVGIGGTGKGVGGDAGSFGQDKIGRVEDDVAGLARATSFDGDHGFKVLDAFTEEDGVGGVENNGAAIAAVGS